jgi:hypothetical protein
MNKKRGSYKKFKETKKLDGKEKCTMHIYVVGIIIQFHIYTHTYIHLNFLTLFSCKAQEVR